MPISDFNKINDWKKYMMEGVNCATDKFMVALSNTAPSEETNNPTTDGNGKLANVSEIDYDNCSSRAITTTSSSQTGGTYKLTLTDLTLSASGGDVGPFRYVYIYDDTVADKPLVCYLDYGDELTLADGESFVIDFDDTEGFFKVS